MKTEFWDVEIKVNGVTSTTFHYSNPPTKEEFLYSLPPWAAVWKDDIIPAIQSNPFPYIEMGYKRSDIEFTTALGLNIEIVVHRNDMVSIPYRDRLHIPHDDVKKALARKYKDDFPAYTYLVTNSNVVIDRHQKTGKDFVTIMKEMLKEKYS